MYNILESDKSIAEKRSELVTYLNYTIRKLPEEPKERQKVAEHFHQLLNTNYFSDTDDGEMEIVLRKGAELRSNGEQSDDQWRVIEELVEGL